MTTEELISHIRVVPDFPKKGIMFQDITTLLKDKDCLKEVTDRLYEHYKDKGITKVVGIESRGFILGPALAYRLGAGFVMARKPGKLPSESIRESYSKEYGLDTLEIHRDSITPGDVCLLHDDLLATGGTMAACLKLVQKFNPSKVYASFIINLTDCPRLEAYPREIDEFSVLNIKENN